MGRQRVGQQERLRWGLVGGGRRPDQAPAFIAHAHSRAIHASGTRQVVCAALHEEPKAAIFSAGEWPYAIHGYVSFDEMVDHQRSLKLDDPQRMHAATVATPNFCHFKQAMALIDSGIPTVCEKPMTMTSDEAYRLVDEVEATGVPLMVFHTYWGHVMTYLARHIVTTGLLGKVLRAKVFYDQDWLRQFLEGTVRQAWRARKNQSGLSCCGGDIGIHAQKQLEFVTGLRVIKILSSHMLTIVEGRELDDDFTVRAKLENDAEVDISASQIKAGHRNRLLLEVNGSDATLIHDLENPEELQILRPNMPVLIYRRGQISPHDGFLRKVPKWILRASYWPAGHPEGLTDAAQRLYDAFEEDVRRYYRGLKPIHAHKRYAGADDGFEHMRFIEAAVKCAKTKVPVKIFD